MVQLIDRATTIERIRAAEAFATVAIAQLQDFHVFTGHSYTVYAQMVNGGQIKNASIQNARTHTTLNEREMASVLARYHDFDLPRVTLYQAVAHFEFFYFDFVGMLLQSSVDTQNRPVMDT